jgi:hypothetical protein
VTTTEEISVLQIEVKSDRKLLGRTASFYKLYKHPGTR